jgi:hypothetical protein
MIFILIGGVILALLVWVGRRPARMANWRRLPSALFAALAAVAAVASAVRGGWIASLVLVGVAAFLGQAARGASAAEPATRQNGISERQARAVLGVTTDAGDEEILAAYRRLIVRAHPDHGGSAELAAQINAARDRLLGKGTGA